MKDDDNIEEEENAAWGEYFVSADDHLLYENEYMSTEEIIEYEKQFHSVLMPEDRPYMSPYCEKCGGNTISLFLFNGKKTFIRCIVCKHHTSIHN